MIKRCSLVNLDSLQEISIITFIETFGDSNKQSDIDTYIDKNLSRDKLNSELTTPTSEFYFLYHQDAIAGYLKLNLSSQSIEVERIYLLKKYQGLGLGAKLLAFACDRGVCGKIKVHRIAK